MRALICAISPSLEAQSALSQKSEPKRMLTKGERRRLGAHRGAPLVYTRPKHKEAKEVTHNEKVEGMEITALSTASDSCIVNLSDIISGFCD